MCEQAFVSCWHLTLYKLNFSNFSYGNAFSSTYGTKFEHTSEYAYIIIQEIFLIIKFGFEDVTFKQHWSCRSIFYADFFDDNRYVASCKLITWCVRCYVVIVRRMIVNSLFHWAWCIFITSWHECAVLVHNKHSTIACKTPSTMDFLVLISIHMCRLPF